MPCKKPILINESYVKCGQCKNCLKQKSREWVLQKEARYSQSGYFVTLTYSDENLPIVQVKNEDRYVNTLVKRDVQLFMKRLRKENDKYTNDCSLKIRYFLVGEYGTKTRRAHYHALIFNITKKAVEKVQKVWSKGHVKIGDINIKTIHYVTNYMLTKNIDVLEGQQKPFMLSSRRNGIGYSYVCEVGLRHEVERNIHGYVAGKQKPILPKYYIKHVFGSDKSQEEAKKLRYKLFTELAEKQLVEAEALDPQDPRGKLREIAEEKEKQIIRNIKTKRSRL